MRFILGLSVVLSSLTAQAATAQCTEWRAGFGASGIGADPLWDSTVDAQLSFDDGSGPALYVGGVFAASGEVAAQGMARWKAGAWEPIGDLVALSTGGVPARVRALHAHDAGSGPELYAAGAFRSIGGVNATNIAKWTGSSWQPLAQGVRFGVTAMVSHDDGSGVKLFVATSNYADAASGFGGSILAWDGVSWTNESFAAFDYNVNALAVFDDGSGPALYAAGPHGSVGTDYITALVRRAGSTWSDGGFALLTSISSGTTAAVNALEVFDDGTGPALYVGGTFRSSNGVSVNNVARWDGANVTTLGSGANGTVQDLHPFDDGGGPALFATGSFSTASGVVANRVARWRAGAWSALGAPAGVDLGDADSLEDFDDGSGPALYVGGAFRSAGGLRADQIARWKSGAWSSLGSQQGFDGTVNVLGAFDSGAGVEIYAAGWFEWVGPTKAKSFAKWNGTSWSPIPIAGFVIKLLTFDEGAGEALYAAGNFSAIGGVPASKLARFDGVQWSEFGGGVDVGQVVMDMAAYDDGSGEKLWIAGDFTSIGGTAVKRVAQWNGAAWWSPPTVPGSIVKTLAVHDDGMGGGKQLYVGGGFVKIGSVDYYRIARWNGSAWSNVGNGFTSEVRELAVFDDGNGAMLYAAGEFEHAPPQTVRGIARWDGVSWLPLNGGLTSGGNVSTLQSFDDGSGPALFAGGTFPSIGGVAAKNLAVWRNSSWAPYGQPNVGVGALAALPTAPGAPAALHIGGAFTTIDGRAQSRLAVLDFACPCPPKSYCTAGVSTNGCAATLNFSGAPSASLATPFAVTASNVEGQKLGLFFYGVSGRAASPWGPNSGLLCVKAPTQRTATINSAGAFNACDGVLSFDWNSFQSTHPGALGQPFRAGDFVYIQAWYRDPPSVKTTALSNALQARVCP